MNNVIAGITVKCSHSHSLNAETGPLGPSREHLLQLYPLPAACPVLIQHDTTSTHRPLPSSADRLWELWDRHSLPGLGGRLGPPALCPGGKGAGGSRSASPANAGPVSRSPIPSRICGVATAYSCAEAAARADARPRDAPGLGFGTCPHCSARSSEDSALCWANTPKAAGSLLSGAPAGTSRDVPLMCPALAAGAAGASLLPACAGARAAWVWAGATGGGQERAGHGEGAKWGLSLCWHLLPTLGQHRWHLAVGSSGPSVGQGRGCRTRPPAPPALGCCSLCSLCPQPKGGWGGLWLPLPQQHGFV